MKRLLPFPPAEVSASFKSETSVSYAFNELDRGSDGSPSPTVSSDLDLRAEDLSLSFRSLQSPALLLFVGSSRREYLALLLNRHGEGGFTSPQMDFIGWP